MKDFHDLWMMARTIAFEGEILVDAIRPTFERHRTPLLGQVPVGLSDCLSVDKPAQRWTLPTPDRLAAAPDSLAKLINDPRASLLRVTANTEVASWLRVGPWAKAGHQ